MMYNFCCSSMLLNKKLLQLTKTRISNTNAESGQTPKISSHCTQNNVILAIKCTSIDKHVRQWIFGSKTLELSC